MSTTKKPQAVKDDEVGPGSDEPFTFTASDSEITITVPSLAKLPRPNHFKLLRLQKQDKTGVEATSYLLEVGLDDETRELLEDLPGEDSERFMREWRDHSGVGLGESRPS